MYMYCWLLLKCRFVESGVVDVLVRAGDVEAGEIVGQQSATCGQGRRCEGSSQSADGAAQQ